MHYKKDLDISDFLSFNLPPYESCGSKKYLHAAAVAGARRGVAKSAKIHIREVRITELNRTHDHSIYVNYYSRALYQLLAHRNNAELFAEGCAKSNSETST